ncbi:MAG: acylneuraminate cytidylyltransferase family protein [Elusimicrobia bacterium]|nr:acylneuraminate cytidylyltransferase family protein [Elusimicrobiota bacterium]
MIVLGVITARGGSKGLPGKNLLPLGGVPLIGWTIRAARESKELTATYVSTDDPAIAEAAKTLGAEVPFLRPAALAQDDSSIFEVLKHAVAEFTARTGQKPDVVVLLQPTTPLRTAAHIDGTIRLITKGGGDSAETVTLDATHPYHRFVMKGDKLEPMFPENARVSRRQEASPAYRPNGGVYAARAEVLETRGKLAGDDLRGFVMDFESSVDIDGPWDYALAQAIVDKKGLSGR